MWVGHRSQAYARSVGEAVAALAQPGLAGARRAPRRGSRAGCAPRPRRGSATVRCARGRPRARWRPRRRPRRAARPARRGGRGCRRGGRGSARAAARPCRITLLSSSGSMLPPDSTATAGVSKPVGLSSMRGDRGRAGGLDHHAWRARCSASRARESDSSETVTTSSTWSRTAAKVMSPGRPTAMPSAIVCIDSSGDRLPRGQRARVGGGALGLHADHAYVGAQRLDRDRDAGQQPAAAGRHQHGAYVGRLLEHLEAERALAGDDVDVVEGVDQHRPGLLGEGARGDERVLEVAAVEDARRRRSRGSPSPWGSARPRA